MKTKVNKQDQTLSNRKLSLREFKFIAAIIPLIFPVAGWLIADQIGELFAIIGGLVGLVAMYCWGKFCSSMFGTVVEGKESQDLGFGRAMAGISNPKQKERKSRAVYTEHDDREVPHDQSIVNEVCILNLSTNWQEELVDTDFLIRIGDNGGAGCSVFNLEVGPGMSFTKTIHTLMPINVELSAHF
jgi:hypothetical protein